MYKATVAVILLCSICQVGFSFKDGLLPNGNFARRPRKTAMNGTVVLDKYAIPNWEISGYVEYIKWGQRQGDMLLVVPDGAFAVRLGNDASIKQKVIGLTKGSFYSITFNVARTCAQEEKLNVSVWARPKFCDSGILPVQTIYSSNGWDSYSWAFQAFGPEVEISIHNMGIEEDPACGPIVDSVAMKLLSIPKRKEANLIKNGDFEEGPCMTIKGPVGVLIPPLFEDLHSPLPGWIVESLKAVKYIDSEHFSVPGGKRAIELIGGKESAISQIVETLPGKTYILTFNIGDANNGCPGSMAVEVYAGNETAQVPYESMGKGGFKAARVQFHAVKDRTRVVFLSSYYSMKADYSGSLCGPVIDDVKLVSARNPRRVL